MPRFTTIELETRRQRHCVCVFVLNEGDRVLRQLEKMRPACASIDVILADGGSTDGSTELEGLRTRGVNTLLVKRGPGKLSAQMRMALAFALHRGYEGVVTIDGNNKDNPGAIPLFQDALDRGVDHIQGSRFTSGGHHQNTPLSRLLAVRLLHAPMISWAAGFHYTDTTNGFRAYGRSFLLNSRVAPFRHVFMRYELHYYLAIRAGELGYAIEEVPVTRSYPEKGPVVTKLSPLKGNLEILRALMAAARHRFDPDPER